MFRGVNRPTAIFAALCAGLFLAGAAHADFESPDRGVAVKDKDPEARPWDLSIRAFAGRDTNVLFTADNTLFFNGRTRSLYGGVSLQGAYRFVQTNAWTVGVAVAADKLIYEVNKAAGEDDSPNEYNFSSVNPGLFAKRKFMVAGFPAFAGVTYDFYREYQGEFAGDMVSHTIGANAGVQLMRNLDVAVSYSAGEDEFDVEFPDQTLDNRDARRHALGISAKYRLGWHFTSLTLSYLRTDNEAEGENFDFTGDTYGARVETNVAGPLWFALNASKANRNHEGFQSGFIPSPGRTTQEIYDVQAQLLWQITRNWIADAYVIQTSLESNQAEFAADKQNVGFGVTYKF